MCVCVCVCVCMCVYIYIYIYIYIWHTQAKQVVVVGDYCTVVSRSVVSDSLQYLDCSQPGPSVHGISQATILEWVAISFSRGSSWLRDQTCISCVACIADSYTRWAILRISRGHMKGSKGGRSSAVWKERYRRKHLSWWRVYALFFLEPKPYIFSCWDLPRVPVIVPLLYGSSHQRNWTQALDSSSYSPYSKVKTPGWASERKFLTETFTLEWERFSWAEPTELTSSWLIPSVCTPAHLYIWEGQKRTRVGQGARRLQQNLDF